MVKRLKEFMKGFCFSTALAGGSLFFLERPPYILQNKVSAEITSYQETFNPQNYFLTDCSQKSKEDKPYTILGISNRGLELIKEFEKFSPLPYLDGNGYSIGYGHQILPKERYTLITKEEAEKLLQEDTGITQRAIEKNVKVPLTQNQYDALCSFVYNVGQGAFRESTLLRKLNSGDYEGASKEFLRWDKYKGEKNKGLANRRNLEEILFKAKK